MNGSIVRALDWDNGYEQQFLAVNPNGDEVILYQTNHDNSNLNELIKLGSRRGFENIQCSSYLSSSRGITGVGSITGMISIFDINSDTSSVLKLKPKQNRPCNAISFNNNNLVAVGFDKGRQDNSLQIWNIEHYSRNSTNDHIKGPLSAYLANEAILSISFYSDLESGLLCGSYKFLREIDLRQDQPVFQMASKYTLGITNDHFKPHLFHSFSEDGSLAIWDRRRMLSVGYSKTKGSNEQPVFQFNKLLSDSQGRKNNNPCVRYSTIRSGEFAAAFNGDLIRRWNLATVPQSDVEVPKSRKEPQTVLQNLKKQSAELYKPSEESLFVSSVLDVKTDYEKVVSFDYSPDITSHTSTNFVCMRPTGNVFRMSVVESIEALDFNSYNEFTITGPHGTETAFVNDREFVVNNTNNPPVNGNVIEKSQVTKKNHFGELQEDAGKYSVTGSSDVDSTADGDSLAGTPGPDVNVNKFNDDDDDYIPLDEFLVALSVISTDIASVIRRRAHLGYAVDADKNLRVLETMINLDTQLGRKVNKAKQESLRHAWKWLGLAKKSLDKGTMVSEGFDLGYQGVLGIWKGVEELDNQNFRISKEHITEQSFTQAIKTIVYSKGKKVAGIAIPSSSEKKAQRKLCLIVSGWYLTDAEFEEKLNALIRAGYPEKAACWAVFNGDVPKAVEILANGNDQKLRLMSTAVAGYLAYKDSPENSLWRNQCRSMAIELDDPHLRAIFAFIADNDWLDVLDENSLPLRERLFVALRVLSDKDLGIYLNRMAEILVAKGELPGLVLTGITPRGIDLLQSYVDKTSDAQTAALISAFACPRYLTDDRVKHWVDCYRNLLNSWGLFSTRAKFDVSRTKLLKNSSGLLTIKATPKQVYLQCIRCNKNISKPKLNNHMGNNGNNAMLLKQFNKMNNNRSLNNEIITACPHCGAPLPRCSICLLNLGTPLPLEPYERLSELTLSNKIENRFREWFSFCLTCNHGSHALHAEEWFSKHFVCPVPDCNCRCNSA